MAYVYTLGPRLDVMQDKDKRHLSEKYRNTAVGMVGTQRKSVLRNDLLIRHRTGKQRKNFTSPELKKMTFGMQGERDLRHNILHHQEFVKRKDINRLPYPDFIWANKASTLVNLHTAKQYNKYLKDNYDMFCTKREKRTIKEFFEPIEIPKVPEHCMFSLLSHEYQRQWEAHQRMKNLLNMQLLWKERYVSCNTKSSTLNVKQPANEFKEDKKDLRWANVKTQVDTYLRRSK